MYVRKDNSQTIKMIQMLQLRAKDFNALTITVLNKGKHNNNE